MKNDYSIGDTKISIPPTLLVTAVGEIEDSNLAVTMDAKKAGDIVYLLGTTYNHMGKTHYFDMMGLEGGAVPKLDNPKKTIESYRWLHKAMKSSLVASCHDLSDGGLGVAAAETAFSGGLGIKLNLSEVNCEDMDRDDFILFSESPGRFLITVSPSNKTPFEIIMGDIVKEIGVVTEEKTVEVTGLGGESVISCDTAALKHAWQKTLSFKEES
jgi:phosphoribosylformylglycinamidine synthase